MAALDRKRIFDEIEAAATRRFEERRVKQDLPERKKYRKILARANRAVVHERQIGKSDLLRVNYLSRGLMVSRAVCHIDIRDGYGNHVGNGTGFLVSPRLLMTNAHVLLNDDEARNSLAAFNYEDDAYSIPKERVLFSLKGEEIFERHDDLDFALVAVARTDIRGTRSLADFGHLKLRAIPGKAIKGEHVTIIQHPNGRSKEIAARANTVIDVFDQFIHYETDTDKGSSGAPVFSDEWEIVAIHHAGVRARDAQDDTLNKDGRVWDPNDGEDEIKWKANEGIRIGPIVERLQARFNRLDSDDRKRRLLREVVGVAKDPASGPYIQVRDDLSEERRNAAWYAAAEGYAPDFLGPEAPVPLPDSSQHQNHASEPLLYRHFSIVMHTGRRQALFTACNIDGDNLAPSSRSTSWKTDPRLDVASQLDNDFYKDQAGRTNRLDRGHLVRRLDPAWGDLARESIDDTFHYTNSALQHRSFNNGLWGRLEDAVMARLEQRTLMTVFTGPIFDPNDPEVTVTRDDGTVGRAQVPLEYWKVLAFGNDAGFFVTAAFRQSQAHLVGAMDLDFEFDEELLTTQVSIVEIQQATGLVFGDLSQFEATPEDLEAGRDRFRHPVRAREDLLISGKRRGGRPTRPIGGAPYTARAESPAEKKKKKKDAGKHKPKKSK